MKLRTLHIFVSIFCLLLVASSCSTKQNTRASRAYFALTTRYNVYYHAIEHFEVQKHEMESGYEDNYSQLIYMHPVSAYAHPKVSQPVGNFVRTIDKCEKAIRTRSITTKPKRDMGKMSDPNYKAFVNREEFNPFIHNAWLLLGKAQFYKGDFLEAAATFNYMARHFSWLPDEVAHARLWLARCYIEMGWHYEAENQLQKLNTEGLPKSQTGWFATVNASYLIQRQQYIEAIPYLRSAIKEEKEKSQRVRMTFLLAQLYTKIDNHEMAYKSYGEVIAMNPAYRAEFNARIYQTEVFAGGNNSEIEKRLERMANDPKNKEYLDQVYYALGNLYLNQGDSLRATNNYLLATEKSTRGGVEKAICQLKLGDIYFQQKAYTKAQPCYTEAMPQIDESYPNYKQLQRRSEVLDHLVVYAQNVELQDSLQRLAAMDEEERNEVFQKIIDQIIADEEAANTEAAMAELQANQEEVSSNLLNSMGAANQPTTNTNMNNGDKSWYFYNPTLINSGKTEFQRKWGSRKLEDDWRRRNKASFSLTDFEETPEETPLDGDETPVDGETSAPTEGVVDSTEVAASENPKELAYYIQQLPLTPEDIEASNEIIIEGLYNMGIILKNELEDYPSAADIFGRLMSQYPENEYLLETYYNCYLMYMRMGDDPMGKVYQDKIVGEFPESKYGVAMADPHYLDNLRNMESMQDSIYRDTYTAYMESDSHIVQQNYRYVKERYPMSELMPKFMFLNALSYVSDRDYDAFKGGLKELLEQYPMSDVSPLSSEMLKGITEGRQVASASVKGMEWSMRLSSSPTDSTTLATDSTATPFTHDLEAPHLLVLAFPTGSVNANNLLFEVARYNFSNFMIKDFDIEIMSFNTLSMLIVKGFNNFDELKQYRTMVNGENGMKYPKEVRPIEISDTNFKTLVTGGYSFDHYFNFQQRQEIIDEK